MAQCGRLHAAQGRPPCPEPYVTSLLQNNSSNNNSAVFIRKYLSEALDWRICVFCMAWFVSKTCLFSVGPSFSSQPGLRLSVFTVFLSAIIY